MVNILQHVCSTNFELGLDGAVFCYLFRDDFKMHGNAIATEFLHCVSFSLQVVMV